MGNASTACYMNWLHFIIDREIQGRDVAIHNVATIKMEVSES